MANKEKINQLLEGSDQETNNLISPDVDASVGGTGDDNGNPFTRKLDVAKGSVIRVGIEQEMQKAYLDYAMSVIVSRALPDVRDGLKPVQRRIIYAMQDQNMTAANKFNKCAAVVGEVMKKYHPHGDSSIYEALVRMGQDFTLRYPLIKPQGNFGSIDGDPPAAMRYTECKLEKITEELFKDIDADTVNHEMNDLQNEEPVYLPSVLPNMLLNGASGIAVGMATNIPPHNLNEVVSALVHMIDNAEDLGTNATTADEVELDFGYKVKVAKPNFSSRDTVEDLVKHVKGPDFPTGGTIYDHKEIIHMYATGKGRVVTKAKMETEDMKGDRVRLVVTEIPYQVNKATLVAKIADLVKNKKIVGIADLRDESNRHGMRIVIELKRDAVVKRVQNNLYKYSPLQSTFNTNMVALIDGEPKLMTLKMVLEEFIKHRQQVVVRRTIFLLKKAKAREHILQGLKKALDHIDEIIALIRGSKDADTAKEQLMKKFGFSDIQAQAILDMQLRRLAALERKKIEDELAQIMKTISDYESLLYSVDKIAAVVKEELQEVVKKYGDERKTKVVKTKVGDIEETDLIENEKCIISISRSGYIKRLKEESYRTQSRGGKGVTGQSLKEEDIIESIRPCNTHDYALFFSNKGKAYKLRVWEIPESSKTAKGTALVNFLSIAPGEKIESTLILTQEQVEKSDGFLVFGTQQGIVKKTSLKDFENIRSNGIAAIKLGEGDNLIWVNYSSGKDEIMLVTSKGQSIRFSEDDARPMGRVAAGIRGVRLSKSDDRVVGLDIVANGKNDATLLTITAQGYGKRTPLSEYKTQNRGGSGILTHKITGRTGQVVSARLLAKNQQDGLLIATESGKFIRLNQKDVSKLGRSTQGVRLIRLNAGDKVTSVAILDENGSAE